VENTEQKTNLKYRQ